MWQLHLPAMQQHSQELMTSGASQFPCGCPTYRQEDAEGTSPELTRSICSFDSCFGRDLGLCSHCNTVTLVSVPTSHVTVEDQEMLSDMGGHRRSFCRWKSTSTLHPGYCHCQDFPGRKMGSCESSFATMESSE